MKLTRLTRHAAGDAQIADLKRIYGEVEIQDVSESLPVDSREAVARFDEIAEGSQVVEAVLPINLIEAILKFSAFVQNGGTVIRAITVRTLDSAGNAVFEFSHYERIIKVETLTERL